MGSRKESAEGACDAHARRLPRLPVVESSGNYARGKTVLIAEVHEGDEVVDTYVVVPMGGVMTCVFADGSFGPATEFGVLGEHSALVLPGDGGLADSG